MDDLIERLTLHERFLKKVDYPAMAKDVCEAAAELERLTAERDLARDYANNLRIVSDDKSLTLSQLRAELSTLQTLYAAGAAPYDAEIDRLRADAERYRWLRNDGLPELCVVSKAISPLYGSQLDAVIDAAMADG